MISDACLSVLFTMFVKLFHHFCTARWEKLSTSFRSSIRPLLWSMKSKSKMFKMECLYVLHFLTTHGGKCSCKRSPMNWSRFCCYMQSGCFWVIATLWMIGLHKVLSQQKDGRPAKPSLTSKMQETAELFWELCMILPVQVFPDCQKGSTIPVVTAVLLSISHVIEDGEMPCLRVPGWSGSPVTRARKVVLSTWLYSLLIHSLISAMHYFGLIQTQGKVN